MRVEREKEGGEGWENWWTISMNSYMYYFNRTPWKSNYKNSFENKFDRKIKFCHFRFNSFPFVFTSFQSLAFLLMLSYWWRPAIVVNSLRVSFSFRQYHCRCSIFAPVQRSRIHLHFSIRILRLHCPDSTMAIRCWFMHFISIHSNSTVEKWKTNKGKKRFFIEWFIIIYNIQYIHCQ